jgi:hypothetical protein
MKRRLSWPANAGHPGETGKTEKILARVLLCASAPLRESIFFTQAHSGSVCARAAEFGAMQNQTGWPAFAGHDNFGRELLS